MFFYTNNIFAGPLLLAIWAIEFYLMTISIRLVMQFIGVGIRTVFYRNLCQLTNPAYVFSKKNLNKINRRLPSWVHWAAIYIAALMLKSLLILILKM